MKKKPQSNSLSPSRNNTTVIARVRPLLSHEPPNSEILTFPSPYSISLLHNEEAFNFTCDKVFPESSPQSELYDYIGKPKIEDVLSGYNGTVFAYGQTGSGKTYTMMGSDIASPSEMGIIPRACWEIFSLALGTTENVEFFIKCSMLEIYKEKLIDLLDNRNINLKVKENAEGIYVEKLTEYYVGSYEELIDILAVGDRARTVASTHLNRTSSRSHSLFILTVKQVFADGTEKSGLLNMVDLAGSENVKESRVIGKQFEEAKEINLSLSALGNVIHALTSSAEHIPYRDSKLTRILQESLGGNFKTSLIVTCSSNKKHVEETLKSLKFAQRAKKVKNRARQNVFLNRNLNKTIANLQKELERAKCEILALTGRVPSKRIVNDIGKEESTVKHGDELESLRRENKGLKEKLRKIIDKNILVEQKNHEIYESYHRTLYLLKSRDDAISHSEKTNGSLRQIVIQLKMYISKLQKQLAFSANREGREGAFQIVDLEDQSIVSVPRAESEGVIDLPTDVRIIDYSSEYSAELLASLESDSAVSVEMSLFNMKNQVLQAGLLNSELGHSLEFTKSKHSILKLQYNNMHHLSEVYKNRLIELDKMFEYLHSSYVRIITLYNKKDALEDNKINCKFVRPVNRVPRSSVRSSFGSSPEQSSFFLNSQLDLYKFLYQQQRELHETKKVQSKTLKDQIRQLHSKSKHQLKLSKHDFNNYLSQYKKTYQQELSRRQSEIKRLNEILAQWIDRYMELQSHLQSSCNSPRSQLSLQRINSLKSNLPHVKRINTQEAPDIAPLSQGDDSPSFSSYDSSQEELEELDVN